MPSLSPVRLCPSTSSLFAAVFLAAPLLLAGCSDSAAENRVALDHALTNALTDYGAVATSHLASADKKEAAGAVYAAPTVHGVSSANPKPSWPDLRLSASRLDQYLALAGRFKAIVDNPDATPAQKAVAGATFAEIQRRRVRFLVGRADLDRATLARHGANLETLLGKLDAQMLAQTSPRGQNIVTLIQEGTSKDTKVASLGDLSKAATEAAGAVEKATAELKAAEEEKGALREKADGFFAKEGEFKLAARRAVGKERFDLIDQASGARCEAEKAEAAILGKDLQLDILGRNLMLCAKSKVALDQAVANYREQLETAKKNLADAGVDTGEAAKKAAALHDQWVAEAKLHDTLFAERVDGVLLQAANLAKEAQDALTKAAAAAGPAADSLLPTLAIDQVGLAAERAHTDALRLRALETHKSNLQELAAREKVWLADQTSFIPARVEELAKTQAQVAKAALAACDEADAAVTAALQDGKLGDEAKAALEGVQKNISAHRKASKELAKDLSAESAAPAAPAEAPKPAEPKAEEPKAEEPKPEPQPQAQPEVQPEPKPEPQPEPKAEPKVEEPQPQPAAEPAN